MSNPTVEAHNNAIRLAQQTLRMQAKRFPTREVGYHHFTPHPNRLAFQQAANELEALILVEGDGPTRLTGPED